MLEVFVELARGALFVALAVAFLVLAWMFLRLARVFSTTEETIKEVSEQVVPLLGRARHGRQRKQPALAAGRASATWRYHRRATRRRLLYSGVRGAS